MSKKLKFLLVALFALLSVTNIASAQNAEVKVNVASAAVAIFNPSFEIGFASRSAVTFDYVGAYAENDYLGTGSPLMVSSAIWGYRQYNRKLKDHGFFYGMDCGVHTFRMNKNIVPLVANDKSEGYYDVGQGYLIGFTFGYKYPLTERLNIETSISGGWHCSDHEGYNPDGVRLYELNPSAEWLPYKAGIYLSYRFW